jgi:hypothetical protein
MIRRSPIKRKRREPRPGDNPAYLDWLRTWPCYVCLTNWAAVNNVRLDKLRATYRDSIARALQSGRCGIVEAAHVGERGLGQKCADKFAMPLGRYHHEHATAGGGPESHHTLGKRFWEFHGIDRDETLALLWRQFEEETGGKV